MLLYISQAGYNRLVITGYYQILPVRHWLTKYSHSWDWQVTLYRTFLSIVESKIRCKVVFNSQNDIKKSKVGNVEKKVAEKEMYRSRFVCFKIRDIIYMKL